MGRRRRPKCELTEIQENLSGVEKTPMHITLIVNSSMALFKGVDFCPMEKNFLRLRLH